MFIVGESSRLNSLENFLAQSFGTVATMEDYSDLKAQIRDMKKQLAKHEDIIESLRVPDIGCSRRVMDESSSSIENEDPFSIRNAQEDRFEAGIDNSSSAPPQHRESIGEGSYRNRVDMTTQNVRLMLYFSYIFQTKITSSVAVN